jgi:hypothetical protein
MIDLLLHVSTDEREPVHDTALLQLQKRPRPNGVLTGQNGRFAVSDRDLANDVRPAVSVTSRIIHGVQRRHLFLRLPLVGAVLLLGLANDAGRSAADAGVLASTLELSQAAFCVLLASRDTGSGDLVMFA